MADRREIDRRWGDFKASHTGLGKLDDMFVAIGDSLIYEPLRVVITSLDLVLYSGAAKRGIKPAPGLPGVARQRAGRRLADLRRNVAERVHRGDAVHKDAEGSGVDR